VTSWGCDGSPSTTLPVVRSTIQSWSECRMATVAYSVPSRQLRRGRR
jgi:hypothetical protein